MARNASQAEGPLRLTVDGMRGSPGRIRSVVDTLRAIPGVREVTVDPRTGGVAIRYEPRPVVEFALSPPERGLDDPHEGVPAEVRAPATTLTRIVETAVIVALEVALQRALGPFWPKRC